MIWISLEILCFEYHKGGSPPLLQKQTWKNGNEWPNLFCFSTEDEDAEVQNGHNGTSNGGEEVGQKLPRTVEVDEEAEMTSNARVTAKITRLCLHSLNPTLQSYGGAIAHNLAIRRVRVMHRPLSSEDEVLILLQNGIWPMRPDD